jgi:hypothetical protein
MLIVLGLMIFKRSSVGSTLLLVGEDFQRLLMQEAPPARPAALLQASAQMWCAVMGLLLLGCRN